MPFLQWTVTHVWSGAQDGLCPHLGTPPKCLCLPTLCRAVLLPATSLPLCLALNRVSPHAYTWQQALGNAKNTWEATSHEVGHNMGLSHDGTASVGYYRGHGDWAPIMGVAYSRNVSQWSRGDYSGANNVSMLGHQPLACAVLREAR
ncbi:hypothetical protein COO60DRAFT_898787 [Scenedesmus sp. NREL 46B-D3]|nr:hypothetical protein COO60DRAFT_898787 [Scenedesmus sp. NREL 46B-D3]